MDRVCLLSATFLLLTVCHVSGNVVDFCSFTGYPNSSYISLHTDNFTSVACTCSLSITSTEDVTVPELYLYGSLTIQAEIVDDTPDNHCPPRLDISPSSKFTYHYCPPDDGTEGTRLSTFHLQKDEEMKVKISTSPAQQIRAQLRLSANTDMWPVYITCSVDNDVDDTQCPCSDDWTSSTDMPFFEEGLNLKMRLLVGCLSALFFLILVGAIIAFLWYRNRKEKNNNIEDKLSPALTASQNPAFESPDPTYAEIDRQPNPYLNFTPDPLLQLGLDARYSMDSGLYSMPNDNERIAGHGALEGPSIMRISNTSLSRGSSGNPVMMTPMTKDEIDALYAKPNKKPKPAEQQSQRSLDTPVNRSNQSLPSFKDPSGSQQNIPPPLATGSRSNSHNNLYANVGLSVAPPDGLDVSNGEMYMTQSAIDLNASRGTMETDV